MKRIGCFSELRTVEAQHGEDVRATLEVSGSPPLAGPPGVANAVEPGAEWEFCYSNRGGTTGIICPPLELI